NTNVTLPAPVLNSAGTLFQTSGKINPVTVVDTRASNPGWTVSGQVSDFSDGATPTANKINGGNLGWVPNVVDQATNQTVTAGGAIAPDNGIAPTATPAAGVGLSTSRTMATATASHGIGTAHLDALLNLNAPTSTPAGTYNATLTLTAI
ncbi:MAG TPA: WxL domain-containing protein, partial [Mycobacterium sp.]|nr:WxL domain-containing protein [Mycobacterium sp.]